MASEPEDGKLQGQNWTLREPCKHCNCSDGRIETRNGQNTVRCSGCDRHLYNAPKTETGEIRRTVQSGRHVIAGEVLRDILLRAGGRCEICGVIPTIRNAGHILSRADGYAAGLTDRDIDSIDNVALMCEECNLLIGSKSLHPKVYAVLLAKWRRGQHSSEGMLDSVRNLFKVNPGGPKGTAK